MPKAVITAIGTYVPERILANSDLEKIVDTSDEWIVRRTGIRERRIAGEKEFTSDLCTAAIQNMIDRYDCSVSDVDLILVCTHTPDFPFPTVSAQLQERFSIRAAGALDLNATCAGFVYGLHLANGMIASGLHRRVLVVAADSMSKITDYSDRANCILFGDGAGAVLVEAATGEQSSFLGHYLNTEGNGGIHVYRTSGMSRELNGIPLKDTQKFVQNGREVYKWAVSTVPHGMREVAERSGVPLERIDWFVPHSANLRMIESICEKSGFPPERTLQSAEFFGNTSAATIPLSIDLALRAGKLRHGDLLLAYGFGGGLVQAGLLLRWLAPAGK